MSTKISQLDAVKAIRLAAIEDVLGLLTGHELYRYEALHVEERAVRALRTVSLPAGNVGEAVTCSTCGGSGSIGDHPMKIRLPCPDCNGTGKAPLPSKPVADMGMVTDAMVEAALAAYAKSADIEKTFLVHEDWLRQAIRAALEAASQRSGKP